MLVDPEPVRALCGSEARFRLLRGLYEDPRRSFHLRGLAAAARVDPAQTHRVLRDLVAAGLCRQTGEAGSRRYQATMEHPVAKALAQTFASGDPAGLAGTPEVNLEETPVLRSLLWTGRKRERIDAREAFRHYENNWAFVRNAPMGPRERRLLERLKREYGGGLING